MKNVLVFPCGSEVGLEINRALENSKHFKLFGASSVDDHGKFLYQNYIPELPHVAAHEFVNEINRVIDLYQIDFLIPAHDAVVLKMAAEQSALKAIVITSPFETCQIARSKKKTYEYFGSTLAVPKIYQTVEREELNFPLFMKPDVGQGSKGIHIVYNRGDIKFYLDKNPDLLLLEYLPGKEYTIDCFTNRKGKLLFSEGRERVRISNGISVNSAPIYDARFKEIAELINKKLVFQGAWFFQVKERVNGELVLLEIAPRIAGTMALFRTCGVNFIELSLFDKMKVDVSLVYNKLDINIDRALCNKYKHNLEYDCVYIDFDDTIIINDAVNTEIMKFIYQLKNDQKKIVLLSKHRLDIRETLNQYAISDALFDEIIVLKEYQEKRDYITNKNSIFVDDSFSERKKVFEKAHIPVFSVDAIEALLS